MQVFTNALLIHTGLIVLLALLVLVVVSTAKMSTNSLSMRVSHGFTFVPYWQAAKPWSSQVLEAQFVITGCTNFNFIAEWCILPHRRYKGTTDRC